MKEGEMKKYLSVIPLIVLLCFVASCQDKAAMAELEKHNVQATLEEQNVTLVHQFFKALDAQDYSFKGFLLRGLFFTAQHHKKT
jgi:hypothetical protein